jgi:RHS repeat-associated protein
VTDNFRFTGMEWDSEDGLNHTLYRQYTPAQCRWESPDPVRGCVNFPQGQNLYSYVRDNPTNLTDPNGNLLADCDPNCSDFWFNLENPEDCPSWCPPWAGPVGGSSSFSTPEVIECSCYAAPTSPYPDKNDECTYNPCICTGGIEVSVQIFKASSFEGIPNCDKGAGKTFCPYEIEVVCTSFGLHYYCLVESCLKNHPPPVRKR